MRALSLHHATARKGRLAGFVCAAVLASGPMLGCRNDDAPVQLSSSPAPEAGSPSAMPGADIGKSAGCLRMMVRVDDFCIDRFEAHTVELKRDGTWTHHPHYLPVGDLRVMAKVERGVFPQGYMDQNQSERACLEAGKRLCTSNEWTRACMGPDNLTFTYGKTEESGKCNTRKEHLLSTLHGADEKKWTFNDFNDPQLDTMPGFLERTGTMKLCVSGFGAYDMVGNLAEWTSDRVYSASDLVPVKEGAKSKHMSAVGNGVFMGSFYANSNDNGPGCYYKTTAHEPTYHDYSTGFRCCVDAKK